MGDKLIYEFDNKDNYTFDENKISLDLSDARLKLQSSSLPFTQNFDNDTGFIYDSSLAEFVGGVVRQKDQRPANSVIASSFTNSLNASWSEDGFLNDNYNANGTPTLSGGKAICIGANGLYYEDSLIGLLSGDWVAKFKYTPDNVTPGSNANIFTISRSSGTTDQIMIFHSPAGNSLRITANGLAANTFGVWIPVAGQEYVFEIFCVSNQVTLFIDGVQLGAAKTINPAQGILSNRVWLGAYSTVYNLGDGSFDDFILYSSASQDENYTFPETVYLTSVVTLPEMEHVGDGSILSFDQFSTSESGTPRYTLQIGRSGIYLYNNTFEWVASDNTYSQANSESTFNSNVGTLDVEGEKYGQFRIIFPSTNTLSYVDILTATMTVNTGYLTTNPSIKPITTIRVEDLISLKTSPVDVGNNYKRFVVELDGVDKWVDNGVWKNSSGFSESNTIEEINSYALSLIDEYGYIRFGMYLHSDDGSVTPVATYVTVEFDFAGEAPDAINYCKVWGYLTDVEGNGTGEISIYLNKPFTTYKTNRQIYREKITIEADPDKNYYWEATLIENENMEDGCRYIFDFGDGLLRQRKVLDEDNSSYNDLGY